jgi:signal transduction histidine kinase
MKAKYRLEFSVDSQLLGELGERLVTRNYIALAELVKNSYDADASWVTLRFINATKGGRANFRSQIDVIDNGHGMLFEEIKNYWMRIATTSKARQPISPIFGRRKTGNKGLGRFACRRLARKLVLETTAKLPGRQEFEWSKVSFDWEEFEPGTTLTEIPCEYETRTLSDGTPGLILRLVDLRESWSASQFDLLRRQLLSVSIVPGIRRKGFTEDPGFLVKFEAPEYPKGMGVLVDQFMDAGWGKLEGVVNKDGVLELTLAAKDIGLKECRLPQRFETLANVKFDIAWVPFKRDYWRDRKTLTKVRTEELMRDQGGVRVYLDGFRVYPYGDPGNDWLDIDKDVARRLGTTDKILNQVASVLGVDSGRAMLNHPHNQNLIGRVHINSSVNMPFQVKLDREGFVWNQACDDLVRAIRLSMQWMVLHYDKYLLLAETKALAEAEEQLYEQLGPTPATGASQVIRVIDMITAEAKEAKSSLPEDRRLEAEAQLDTARQVIQRSFTRMEAYVGVLRAVASSGNLMFQFSHEVRNLMSRLDTHANSLSLIARKLSGEDAKEVTTLAESLRTTRDRLDQQIKLFGTLGQKPRDIEKKHIPIKRVCYEVVQGFDYLIQTYGMNEVRLDVPDTLKSGPMLEIELFSIVINLLSNAVKANLAGGGKNILIQARREGDNTVIRVLDDGIGLQEEFREKVFEPLSADPDGRLYEGLMKRVADEELAALGRGSGIGLSIVRGISEDYGGKARFFDVKPPWKTGIEVVLP